jgi:hypothetical protein
MSVATRSQSRITTYVKLFKVWYLLSSNPADVISILKQMLKVDWHRLYSNPTPIPILEQTLDKVDWHRLSSNPTHFLSRTKLE